MLLLCRLASDMHASVMQVIIRIEMMMHVHDLDTKAYRCVARRYQQRMDFHDFSGWLRTGILYNGEGENYIGPKVWRWLKRRQDPILHALAMGFHPRLGAQKNVSHDILICIIHALHCTWMTDLCFLVKK